MFKAKYIYEFFYPHRSKLINSYHKAIEYRLYSYKAVKNILDEGLDRPREASNEKLPLHDNIRGAAYYN
ncbi:MAG: hypothetical protein KJ821_07060 [Actinobacteria bacterium]|nr:hypothetical protein [Actinomycetota bacterium]MBU4483611.1 hypothetical protein [Actinomycetota bacterium]MCG2790998.1 hypothetical protein [Actinomycetes bacterium]